MGSRGEPQSHAHKLAGPQLVVLVWKRAFELDGSRGGVDRIVDEGKNAALLPAGIGLRSGMHRQLALSHVALDIAQLRFRNRERDVDRLNLGDGHQFGCIGGHHVALLHRDAARAAVDGRLNGGVVQLDLDVLHRGLVGHDLRAGAFDGGFVGQHGLGKGVGAGSHLVGLLTRDHALIEQATIPFGLVLGVLFVGDVARQVGLRLAQRGRIARQIGLCLAELGFERPPVDGEQQVALLHGIAFVERNLGQLAAHLRFHADGGIGFHIADDIDVDGNVPLRHHRHYHGDRPALASAAPASRPARLHAGIIASRQDDTDGDQNQDCSRKLRGFLG